MKRIAIQGIAGSFHEDAARKYFEDDVEVVECKTFTTVCEMIDADKVDFAVMAIRKFHSRKSVEQLPVDPRFPFTYHR